MPLWVWILLTIAVLLAIGWSYDRKRRRARGLDRPAAGGAEGLTASDARRDAAARGQLYDGGN
jgi:hypothetical protein